MSAGAGSAARQGPVRGQQGAGGVEQLPALPCCRLCLAAGGQQLWRGSAGRPAPAFCVIRIEASARGGGKCLHSGSFCLSRCGVHGGGGLQSISSPSPRTWLARWREATCLCKGSAGNQRERNEASWNEF